MIQLQRLEGVYWVARTEGYARAARAFPYPITQPGVHQQVRRLEEDLGLTLFERVGKDRVQLTAAGRALYTYVAPFLEGLPSLERALKGGTFGGQLRIHAASLHLRGLLPPWLRRLQAKHPEIEVLLTEARQPDVTVLRHGDADLLIDHLFTVPPDIEVVELGKMHTFLVLPSNHRLAKRRAVKLDELGEDTFIAYNPDQGGRALQLRALELGGARPLRVHGADSAETILGFVAAGIGYSLVPSLSASGPKVAGVVSHPVKLPGSTFPVHAAWRKGGAPHPLRDAALALAPGAGALTR